MPWYVKFLVAGAAVTVAGLVAKRVGPAAAGMVLAFPFIIGSGLIFAAGDSAASMRQTALGALWGLVPLTAFLLTVVVASSHWPPTASLATGVAAWVVVAVVVYRIVA